MNAVTSFKLNCFILKLEFPTKISTISINSGHFLVSHMTRRCCSTIALSLSQKSSEKLLVVVGGGAAGIYGAIRAKTVGPNLNVVVFEKGKPLSKVKVSGGGRCNLTNGHCSDNLILAENYPRGYKELRGSFFKTHGPKDTMAWFSNHGVELKTEGDGRVFPVSNNSSSVVDCLMSEAKHRGVELQTGRVVTSASMTLAGKFLLKIEKRTVDIVEFVEADYLLIASGSSKQGYALATQLGHSIVEPVPSLFTFKIEDPQLAELSGVYAFKIYRDINFPFSAVEFGSANMPVVTFSKVKAKLKLETSGRSIPQLTQVGAMLVTHWGLSGPVILRLSAWGARDLSRSDYKGILDVDFAPDIHVEDVKSILSRHKNQFVKQKVLNSYPPELGLAKRFWKYVLDREGLNEDILWASIPNSALLSLASKLKHCSFRVKGKGQFKDEFVTAGGVPLSEVTLSTMESKVQANLFFAGEVLNVDGVTGGFNFQNAWSGGYIAGTSIGSRLVEGGGTEGV